MSDEAKAEKSVIERHIQSILGAIVLALCVWTATTVQKSAVQLAGTDVKVESLKEQIAELKAASADRYTSSDAARDLAAVDVQLQEVRQRLRALEQRPNGG